MAGASARCAAYRPRAYWLDGAKLGTTDRLGDGLGASLGANDAVGRGLGRALGDGDGTADGRGVGCAVGGVLGAGLGGVVGGNVGLDVGMPDGALVSLQVRKGILSSLVRLDVDETILGSLRSSGIGKYVKLLTLHKRELPENKRVAQALIEKWSRPIFNSTVSFRAVDVEVQRPRSS